MDLLALHPRSIFLGQSVGYAGTGMTNSFKNVPREKLLELPVFEETQLGMSIGLSLEGMLPVSVFPRWNFLLCAMNQLCNHLDKISLYSDYRPKVIIRVAVGNSEPLNPGPQHLGDFSNQLEEILQTVKVWKLDRDQPKSIIDCYHDAMNADHSTILVEYPELYNA
jgi:pyruvate/2-oxoglutarate/acetoin dehydrogenase E1 component